jgi:hypothetical protein
MSYHGNFSRATLVHYHPDTGKDTLVVEGTSSQQPHDAKEIHVALPHGGKLLSASVEHPTATDWRALFTEAEPPFAMGEDVLVVGVAVLSTSEPPFVWHDVLQTMPRAAPP